MCYLLKGKGYDSSHICDDLFNNWGVKGLFLEIYGTYMFFKKDLFNEKERLKKGPTHGS